MDSVSLLEYKAGWIHVIGGQSYMTANVRDWQIKANNSKTCK